MLSKVPFACQISIRTSNVERDILGTKVELDIVTFFPCCIKFIEISDVLVKMESVISNFYEELAYIDNLPSMWLIELWLISN